MKIDPKKVFSAINKIRNEKVVPIAGKTDLIYFAISKAVEKIAGIVDRHDAFFPEITFLTPRGFTIKVSATRLPDPDGSKDDSGEL